MSKSLQRRDLSKEKKKGQFNPPFLILLGLKPSKDGITQMLDYFNKLRGFKHPLTILVGQLSPFNRGESEDLSESGKSRCCCGGDRYGEVRILIKNDLLRRG